MKTSASKLAFKVLFTLILSGGIPIFAGLGGLHFIPSVAYYAKISGLSITVGVLAGALVSGLLLFANFPIALHSAANVQTVPYRYRFFGGIVLGPAIGVLAFNIIAVSLPLLSVVLAGKEDNVQTYTVKSVSDYVSQFCPNKIGLQSLPWNFDGVCGLQDPLRSTIEAGMTIEVIGHGNWMGIIYDRIRIVPPD